MVTYMYLVPLVCVNSKLDKEMQLIIGIIFRNTGLLYVRIFAAGEHRSSALIVSSFAGAALFLVSGRNISSQ